MRATVILWLTFGVVALAVVPTVWVLSREALRRAWTRRALRQVEQARSLVGDALGADATELAESLRQRFDTLTVERAVLEMLRSDDARARMWGSRLFGQLGLVERYIHRLRKAPKWSERAHAAEVLGLAGAPAAVPALVDALRDRDEDEASVKVVAAAALAKLRDPSAIGLFVKELEVDQRSSRNVAEALVEFGGLAVPALLARLADPSHPAARVWAARILGQIGDARAVDDLIARLHDRDDRLRMTAAEALGVIGDPRALQSIVRATLRDPAPQVRAHAAGAVARIEGERAVDVLVAALGDPDYATRIRALEAFETMQIEDTSPLEVALRDANGEVRRRAALALERVGYLERIITRLTSEDRAVRTRAFAALLEVGEAGLVESIASYVHHASFEVRAIAARACGELGEGRVAPTLLRAIEDPSWPVRAAVCEALGRLGHQDALPALVRALCDSEETVREAAADALTSAAPEPLAPHIEALSAAYDRGSVAVRKSIVVLVGRVAGGSSEALLVRATVDPSDAVRLPAVESLGIRGAEAHIEPLVARLTDASVDVRMAAVTALGSTGRVEAFEGLLRALAGAPGPVRDRIAEALARNASGSLFERIPELERNASIDVRLGIAWTLGKIGDPKGVPILTRFLRATEGTLRASAAGALAKIAHPAARDALLLTAQDPDGRVRAAVVNGLGRVGGGHDGVLAALELRTRDPDAFVRNRALIALARAGGAQVETRVRAQAGQMTRDARLLALALVGTDTAVASVLDAMAEAGALEGILAFLDREDPALRTAFLSALRLEDRSGAGAPLVDAPGIVAQYEKTLRSSLDVEARRLAVAALKRLALERATPVLADALSGDPNETVRMAAAEALSDRASNEIARRALVGGIADPSSEVAIVAVRAVEGRREREVVSALQQRLGVGAPEVQDVVEAALARLHRDDPMPFLDWMMGFDVPDLLTPAVRVLARMGSPQTLPLLRELLRSQSASVRATAVRAVANLPVADAAAALEPMAQDPSEDVRKAVVDAITWNTSTLTRLALLRRDPSVAVRVGVATALQRVIGASAKSAHKALESMLTDASAVVRAAAFASLAGSADADGLRAFGRLWPQAALDTRLALRGEPRVGPLSQRMATRLVSSADPAERKTAVVALGALGGTEFATHIAPALRDPTPDVRVAAIQALASVDDAKVRALITEMLTDPDAVVQEAARRSLLYNVG